MRALRAVKWKVALRTVRVPCGCGHSRARVAYGERALAGAGSVRERAPAGAGNVRGKGTRRRG